MTNQEFEAKAVELVQGMINTMAAKEYAKLAFSLPPKASWASYIDAEEAPVSQGPFRLYGLPPRQLWGGTGLLV